MHLIFKYSNSVIKKNIFRNISKKSAQELKIKYSVTESRSKKKVVGFFKNT